MKDKLSKIGFITLITPILLVLFLSQSEAKGPKTHKVNCDKKKQTIQKKVDKAKPGDVIEVSGTCNENIEIIKDDIRLQAATDSASITGAVTTRPVIRVRASRAQIIGFTLSGGSNVIQVQEGGSAIIESNEIFGANRHGILLTQNSYALVGGNSSSEENDIHDNERGITIRHGSSAGVFFNNIHTNDRGINVTANGSVDMADNVIEDSDERGLNISSGGNATISSTPATTGGPNTFTDNTIAIRCRLGGSASGGLPPVGQIDGGGNGTKFDVRDCHFSSSIFFAP